MTQPFVTPYRKRVAGTLAIDYDFREFVAGLVPGDGVTFTIRSDAGITLVDSSPQPNVLRLVVTSGRAGQEYVFGVEAVSQTGRTKAILSRVRLIEPLSTSGIPVVEVIDPGGLLVYLTNAGGELLLSAATGEALYVG